jgi:hypothetical protein
MEVTLPCKNRCYKVMLLGLFQVPMYETKVKTDVQKNALKIVKKGIDLGDHP